MVAVVLGASGRESMTLLCTLADDAVRDDLGLEQNPVAINELYKYGLMPALLQALRDEVGYPAPIEEIMGIRCDSDSRIRATLGERVSMASST